MAEEGQHYSLNLVKPEAEQSDGTSGNFGSLRRRPRQPTKHEANHGQVDQHFRGLG